MRHALLVAALLFAGACKDDDAKRPDPPASNTDAGVTTKPTDAGPKTDAAKPASKLEQPGTLPRAPKGGLPDDLRPPR